MAAAAAIVFFTVSVLLLGFWPGRVLDRQIAAMTPDNVYSLSEAETRGRAIYAREGCAYCHTQQIRYTTADIARFGAPTLAWEGQFDTPHLWGTRRVGPDLSRASGTRSRDWHYAHLFSPRSVVPWSIMPAYAVWFDGSADRPLQEARDLVAYLESLGRARELAWPDGENKARALYPDDKWVQMALGSPALNAHPGKTLATGPVPPLAEAAQSAEGEALWQNLCIGCHGPDGTGNGPAATWLTQKPKNLSQYTFTSDRLMEVLWQGVPGTAMPAWRDLSPGQLAALVAVVQGFAQADSIDSVDAGQLAQGEVVYQNNCIQCHGESGDGRGFAAAELDVPPTDFTRKRPAVGESVRVLNNGVEGTAMAPWTDRLNEADILAVTYYLRRFYGDEP
jgi:mono/diheme cytochrome c family protein